MAEEPGTEADAAVAELVRAIAQDLANGQAPEAVADGLARTGGISRDQARRLVEAVVQARERHENSAAGRAQKRSQGQTKMLQGTLFALGGVGLTVASFGSGSGRLFYGAVLYGAYQFITGLVLWGGNTALLGDDEELKKQLSVRLASSLKEPPGRTPGALATPTVGPPPQPSTPPKASAKPPAPAQQHVPRPISAKPPTPPRVLPRVSAKASTTVPLAPTSVRSLESTAITRVYAIAFIWDQIVGLALPYGVFGKIGLGLGFVAAIHVVSILTFVSGILCTIHVLVDKLSYRFLVLPGYHVLGSLLMGQLADPLIGVLLVRQFSDSLVLLLHQLSDPRLIEQLSIAHSFIGLVGGIAWLIRTGELRQARPMTPASVKSAPRVQGLPEQRRRV